MPKIATCGKRTFACCFNGHFGTIFQDFGRQPSYIVNDRSCLEYNESCSDFNKMESQIRALSWWLCPSSNSTLSSNQNISPIQSTIGRPTVNQRPFRKRRIPEYCSVSLITNEIANSRYSRSFIHIAPRCPFRQFFAGFFVSSWRLAELTSFQNADIASTLTKNATSPHTPQMPLSHCLIAMRQDFTEAKWLAQQKYKGAH